MKPQRPPSSHSEIQIVRLVWLAIFVSVFSFLFYYRHGDILLYGDAVAHINIARRVFDSKTPGLLQLGTVWLPLPHLLMIPFLISGEMWHRGAGGSIPSMVAYVLGVVGMFRLVRGALSGNDQTDGSARIAAWIAVLVYATNPNLIYMQTTAMGESIYLAFFIWAVVYFSEFTRRDGKALTKCGVCLAAACLTRYDGWFLAAGMAAAVVLCTFLRSKAADRKPADTRRQRTAIVRFLLIASAAPALWLAYNGLVYRNPLEFENGPYSAKAIERKTQTSGNPGHPGSGNPVLAGLYFFKSAEENVAVNESLQRAWVLLAVGGLLGTAFNIRQRKPRVDGQTVPATIFPLAFFLVPVLFYSLSVAYGGVPIFVPPWWPFTL